MDNNEKEPTEQKTVGHNISINVTDADSPSSGVRRRIHLRSLSDVTPASRAHTPRARSHSDRPRASPAPSPARPAPLAPPLSLRPRAVRSERSSPDASQRALDAAAAAPDPCPTLRDRDALGVLGNPWRKMSDLDLHSPATRPPLDPWIRNSTLRPESREGGAPVVVAATGEAERKREPVAVTFKRGKLERRSPVVCESCGNESCECWRTAGSAASAGSAGGASARSARAARSLGACTCTPAASPRSPRPSPARLAPARALSDDEERSGGRRLYKSSSQRVICSSMDGERGKAPAADPLLETTC